MIAAFAAAAAIRPEPRDGRMLVESAGAVVAISPEGTRRRLLDSGGDASYSPDGTLVAFVRDGDLWLANADGSGQRRLAETPAVEESQPAWSPDGAQIAYTATVDGRRQIRAFRLPTGPSVRIEASATEEWSAAMSRTGRIAFVSNRDGAPTVYVDRLGANDPTPFDTTPPTEAPNDIRHVRWSPDGRRLVYASEAADGTTAIVVDDGTTQTAITQPGTDERPVWSPTGSRIVFDDDHGSLQSVAADGSDPRELGSGAALDWRVVPVGTPKFPNLVQRPPSGLVVTQGANGHWLLGFTSMVDNRGPGILWIRANRPRGSKVMLVRQLVQLAGGGVRVLPHSGELHYVVAPPHYHWHFIGFDRYELRRAGTSRCSCATTRAASASPTTGAPPSASRTARRASSATASSSIPRRGRSRRDRRSATPTATRRISTARTSTSRTSRPAATGSSTARTRTSTSARSTTATMRPRS